MPVNKHYWEEGLPHSKLLLFFYLTNKKSKEDWSDNTFVHETNVEDMKMKITMMNKQYVLNSVILRVHQKKKGSSKTMKKNEKRDLSQSRSLLTPSSGVSRSITPRIQNNRALISACERGNLTMGQEFMRPLADWWQKMHVLGIMKLCSKLWRIGVYGRRHTCAQ